MGKTRNYLQQCTIPLYLTNSFLEIPARAKKKNVHLNRANSNQSRTASLPASIQECVIHRALSNGTRFIRFISLPRGYQRLLLAAVGRSVFPHNRRRRWQNVILPLKLMTDINQTGLPGLAGCTDRTNSPESVAAGRGFAACFVRIEVAIFPLFFCCSSQFDSVSRHHQCHLNL